MAKLYRRWLSLSACASLLLASVVPTVSAADAAEPAARIAELRAQIAHHDELYYKKAAPEISDSAYDRLKEELAALERAHPDLAATTAAAGGAAPGFDDRTGRFPTARHRVPMTSLDKAFDEPALRAFHARVLGAAGVAEATFVVEPKIDGIAIAVTYERGRLVRAVTRGDGNEGDDITANVLTIDALPRELACADGAVLPEVVELRGELYLSFESFARINRARDGAGEPPFANPRNAAAGTAKLTSPAAVAGRGLEIAFFGLSACEPESARPSTQQALFAQLRRWGAPTVDHVAIATGVEELLGAVRALGEARGGWGFPSDGAVVKLDDIALRARLGDGPQAPRWAVAYKFAPLRASTRVRAIVIQVGRTGALTPVAEFDPVALAGSTVARASLHNREALARADVRVGDTVFVEKAGEIIPAIVGVDRARRPEDAVPFVFPDSCPACATPIEAGEGGPGARCPNEACPAQIRRRLEHYASEAAVNIVGLGPAMVDRLVARTWVHTPADLYRLRREQLLELGGDVAGTTDGLLAAIERSKSAELWRVIHGLSIPRVGETTARDLATAFPDLAALAGLEAADFAAEGRAADLALGRASEEAIVAWFADPGHRALVRDLAAVGMRPRAVVAADAHRSGVAGRIFVLTGRLEHLARDVATDRIRAAGGRVVASVSGKTDYLVAGEDPGEKLARAEALGVQIIDEAELLRLLEEP